jgi:hypothetical protein
MGLSEEVGEATWCECRVNEEEGGKKASCEERGVKETTIERL